MSQARPDPGRVSAVYRVQREAVASEDLARLIAIEQTVEIPEALIPPGKIRDEVVGRVESVTADPGAPGAHRITISYGAELARDLFGLLAVVIGNAPMYGGVRLVELQPPRALLEALPGPNHGVEGVRRMCGVLGRPLLATALKPQGSSVSELASIGEAFARGGGSSSQMSSPGNTMPPTANSYRT